MNTESENREILQRWAEMLNNMLDLMPPIDTTLPMDELEEKVWEVMREELPEDIFSLAPGTPADSNDLKADVAVMRKRTLPEDLTDPGRINPRKN